MPTQVPKIKWRTEGPELPLERDILTGVQSDIDAAFGGGVNPSLTSPQGQLAQSLTAIISDKNDALALLTSMVDPDSSEGRWQDAIGKIYFLERKAGSGTLVMLEIVGLPGTVIPQGTRARNSSGYEFATRSTAVIAESSKVLVPAQCTQLGPIGVPANSVTQIVDTIPGWDLVNNPEAGIPGRFTESRTEFERRRRDSVALGGLNSTQAVRALVLAQDGVIDCYAVSNDTKLEKKVGATDFVMQPNSILVTVSGGVPRDIAKAIWMKKSAGCGYNGDTTVTIEDDSYPEKPFPEYQVTYQTARQKLTYFKVVLTSDPDLPANITDLVKKAITDRFYGTKGGSRQRIGGKISASSYYCVLTDIDTTVVITSLTVGWSAAPSSASVTAGVDEIPVVNNDTIIVLVEDAD